MANPISRIYAAAFYALRTNPLIYLLLLLWGLTQGVVIAAIALIGGVLWLSFAAVSTGSPHPTQSIALVTISYLTLLLLVVAVLGAALKAGLIAFGAKIRTDGYATTLDFLHGIFTFTLPLFMGGIFVAMLTLIPALGYLVFLRFSFSDFVSDILTSGWNFNRALSLLGFMTNSLLLLGVIQTLVFFWITPWDEMVVLYRIPFPEALWKSFTFVFSRANFLKVVVLVLANTVISIIALALGNVPLIREGLPDGFPTLIYRLTLGSSSALYSFLQFILLPFFAFSQLYLLPLKQSQSTTPESIKPSTKEINPLLDSI